MALSQAGTLLGFHYATESLVCEETQALMPDSDLCTIHQACNLDQKKTGGRDACPKFDLWGQITNHQKESTMAL